MIAVLSDFGDSEYLGEMKGVIYSVNPKAVVSDLCNSIESHNIKEGAWILLRSYIHFPRGAVFLCVVDPGVGGERKAIAVKTKNYWFVGPDNGLMYPAAREDGIEKIIELVIAKDAAKIFHGRDVFAPSAAGIDMGRDINGREAKEMEKLEFYLDGREGEIVRIDKFGNIVTNIPPVKGSRQYILKTGKGEKTLNFYENYEEAKEETFLTEGSAGTLEIACKNREASREMGLKVGDKVEIS